MEMEGDRVEVYRSHERDEAGVEGGEVRDRSEDVAKRDVAAAVPRRYGDSAHLLDFDGCGYRRVAEQALRDAEVRHDPVETIAERDTGAREHGQPAEHPPERVPRSRGGIGAGE